MKTLGVICARSGSKKFPGKNLAEIDGKPLLWYSVRAARASKLLDRFVVSTNSEAIAAVARSYHVDVPFLRPPEFSTDTARIEDALIHALSFCEEQDGCIYDCVVLLQNSSPLRMGSDINGCIELLRGDLDASSSATAHLIKYPHMLRVYEEDRGRMYPLQTDWGEIYRRQDAPSVYMLNGVVFAVKRDYLLNLGRVIASRCVPYVIEEYRAIDVDAVDDMNLVRKLL